MLPLERNQKVIGKFNRNDGQRVVPWIDIMSEYYGFWVEKAFKRIPLPYPIVSIIISISIYLIFYFFSFKVDFFPMEFYHRIEVSALSILIGIQLIGIQYFLNRIRKEFNYLLPRSVRNERYCAIAFLVIASYIGVVLIRSANGEDPFFFSRNPGYWELMLDIFNQGIIIFSFLLLSGILWIIFNIVSQLYDISNDRAQDRVKVDLFSLDRIGGLNPLKGFILAVTVVYLINIILMIVSYFTPFGYITYESIFILILLFIGLGFFLQGFSEIRQILQYSIDSEFSLIAADNQNMKLKFKQILSEGRCGEMADELNSISTALGILDGEREKLLNLNVKIYDVPTLLKFLITFLASLMTYLQKLYEFQSTELFQQLLGYLK